MLSNEPFDAFISQSVNQALCGIQFDVIILIHKAIVNNFSHSFFYTHFRHNSSLWSSIKNFINNFFCSQEHQPLSLSMLIIQISRYPIVTMLLNIIRTKECYESHKDNVAEFQGNIHWIPFFSRNYTTILLTVKIIKCKVYY